MYKAIKQIGDFKIGDVVPDRQAEQWLEQYAVPHVKLVSGKNEKVEEETEPKFERAPEETTTTEDSSNMLDDYLNRNKNVVKKNLEKDKFDHETLQKLYDLEKSDKNRDDIIKALEESLKKGE